MTILRHDHPVSVDSLDQATKQSLDADDIGELQVSTPPFRSLSSPVLPTRFEPSPIETGKRQAELFLASSAPRCGAFAIHFLCLVVSCSSTSRAVSSYRTLFTILSLRRNWWITRKDSSTEHGGTLEQPACNFEFHSPVMRKQHPICTRRRFSRLIPPPVFCPKTSMPLRWVILFTFGQKSA